jgi:geranylgeranyl diphosphate synthase type II
MQDIKSLAALYERSFPVSIFDQEPRSLYEPVKHIMSIPGKRIRPLLVLLSCDAFGGQVDGALNASYAMEIFHNFTLVHDDIMDKADLRRGRPTVHKVYGLNAGILAGDVMMSHAYKQLCTVSKDKLSDVLDIFNKTSIEIYEGQQMDVDFETRMDVEVAEYLTMIKYKTSVLLACSLQIGAIIAGASKEDQQRIYDFGLNLGLSFQIKDDWLDTYGEGDKVGKTIGGDIIQNKKTYLLITLLSQASNADRNELVALLSETDEAKKISGVKALYDKYDVSGKTLTRAEEIYQEALASLAAVSLADDRKANLLQMAAMVHDRQF